MPDSFLCASILDSAAIECFLLDENTIRMDWFWSNFLGGIKLCVRKLDADAAASLLDQSILEKFEVDRVGEYQQPRCTKCQSLRVSFQGLNRPTDYVRALYRRSPLHRSLWECDSCGNQWPESSERPPAFLLTLISSILLIVLAISNIGSVVLFSIFAVARFLVRQ